MTFFEGNGHNYTFFERIIFFKSKLDLTRWHRAEINDIQNRDPHGSLLHGGYVRYVREAAAEDCNVAAQQTHR